MDASDADPAPRDAGGGGSGWIRVAGSGGGGSGGLGGSGGATLGASGKRGMSGMDAPKREPCEANGAVRCAASGVAGARERCAMGAWMSEPACESAEVCSDRPKPGTCQPLAAVCKGSAGKSVCDSAGVMYDCDEQGVVTDQRPCASARHCQPGIEKGVCLTCIPGEYRCTGAQLERCGENGMGFALEKKCDTPALCNAVAGDCTTATCKPMQFTCQTDKLQQCNSDQTALLDVSQCQPGLCDAAGGQCDVCAPGAKGCDGGKTVMTCDAQGQGSSRTECPPDKSHCVGMGQCVECATADDCPDPGPCKQRFCNTGTGMCAPRDGTDGAACSSAAATGTCSRGACDLCSPNPCQNGAKCGADLAAISCMCAPGYTGSRCEVNPCAPHPCQHAGACSVTAGGASCSCTGGYIGARCEVDACAPNPCQNGGTCSRTSTGGFSCACPNGYGGSNCQTDACSPNPCQHAGVCSRTSAGGHSCACTGGYTGANCESDPCNPSPCPVGVACTRTATGASCAASCAPNCDVGQSCVMGNECTTTVCTNNKCACTKPADCTALKPGDCQVAACSATGSCELQNAPPGTACGTNGTCSTAGKCEYCGDGVINGKEECEVSAKGWSVQTCGMDCKRRYYKHCETTLDCDPSQYCLDTVRYCTTMCQSESATTPTASTMCPPNPLGPEPKCLNSVCVLPCAVGSDCPADLQSCYATPVGVSACADPR